MTELNHERIGIYIRAKLVNDRELAAATRTKMTASEVLKAREVLGLHIFHDQALPEEYTRCLAPTAAAAIAQGALDMWKKAAEDTRKMTEAISAPTKVIPQKTSGARYGFERYSDRSRRVMGLARQEAQKLNHECIDTAHMLLALMIEELGKAAEFLKSKGITRTIVRDEIELLIAQSGRLTTIGGKIPFTECGKRALDHAAALAEVRRDPAIYTEHLLVGVLEEAEGIGAQALTNLGHAPLILQKQLLATMGRPQSEPKVTPERTPTVVLQALAQEVTSMLDGADDVIYVRPLPTGFRTQQAEWDEICETNGWGYYIEKQAGADGVAVKTLLRIFTAEEDEEDEEEAEENEVHEPLDLG